MSSNSFVIKQLFSALGEEKRTNPIVFRLAASPPVSIDTRETSSRFSRKCNRQFEITRRTISRHEIPRGLFASNIQRTDYVCTHTYTHHVYIIYKCHKICRMWGIFIAPILNIKITRKIHEQGCRTRFIFHVISH